MIDWSTRLSFQVLNCMQIDDKNREPGERRLPRLGEDGKKQLIVAKMGGTYQGTSFFSFYT